MKKNLWFLTSLILLFASSCNNEELGMSYQTQNGADAKANHFYGVKSSGAEMTKGVAQKTNLWYNGSVISVGFVNGSDADKARVKKYAAEWEKHANIEFEFVESGDALVRVGFDRNDERYITWSYVGTDCKNVTDQNEATMSFAYWDTATEEEMKGDVLRTFGQVLGLELEHRHLDFDANWTAKISEYWEGEIEDIPWASLQKYVFTPLEAKNVLQTAEYDENSIMIWPFARKYAGSTARAYNNELSDMDIAFIGQLYPKDGTVVTPPVSAKSTVLTFTEEVELPLTLVLVDGDVKILVDGKLAYQGNVSEAPQTLKGTVFDIKAEKLKIVNESGAVKMPQKMKTVHLTDIEYTYWRFQSQTLLEEITLGGIPHYTCVNAGLAFMDCRSLKSVPKGLFDNCPNITDFGHIFFHCKSLTSVPDSLFANCPNVISFVTAFNDCTSLKELPENLFANCTKVTTFQGTFANCTSLTAIPENLFADCSNIGDFFNTFSGCRSLTSLPEGLFAKQKNVTRTWGLFSGCTGLTSIPEGLFSSFTEHRGFSGIFEGCVSLTSIPENLFANCVRADDFNNIFSGCRNLTAIPPRLFANNVKAYSFGNTFKGCSSLTSIPADLFANNTKAAGFDGAFSACINLQAVPKGLFVNCSAVGGFTSVFDGCNMLKTIPGELFPNGSNNMSFNRAFAECHELTEIPADLFKNTFNTSLFEATFYRCKSLKNVPAGLFDNCPNVQSYRNVFSQCNSLVSVPENLFSKSTKATNFENAFLSCSLIQSSVPRLWESHPSAISTACFRGTTQATNYAEIPAIWK